MAKSRDFVNVQSSQKLSNRIRVHFSCHQRKRSRCLISAMISIKSQPTSELQHHSKQCNHAKRRVALAVPPFIHPDSLRRRLCTFSRLQKGQGSSKTPRTRAQNLPYLFAILGFLPTIETPNTVEISTVCQPAECFTWSSEGDLPAPVDSCC